MDLDTLFPLLAPGKILSPQAEGAWELLKEERADMKEVAGTKFGEFVPDWFERHAVMEKRTRGDKRAARRERERMEGRGISWGVGT